MNFSEILEKNTPPQDLRIYDWPTGPYPARIRVALAEKNLLSRVEFVTVSLRKGEHKTPAFLALNYSGTLPVLELRDGSLIAECTAITEYLDNLHSPPSLTGATPLEKGMIHMMNKRAELELLDAISVYFHHATPGLGPKVEHYQNPEWGLRQRDRALRGMQYFDRVLQQQPFIAGDSFSMADITVIGGLIFASIVNLPIPLQCEALQSWYGRMQERPGVKYWFDNFGPR
ncbi:glutathione S-transferase [Ferrovibrio sp.]|uniref:glutathione S-transferase n=1 Tax=Ferrovibrio sp. TaxID=1917215 RepID=UPI0025B9C0B4|nr:glutathione S-transferase [Ferrovibrio sp.]